MTNEKRVLICGNQAFAAQGLGLRLRDCGFKVDGYARRSESKNNDLERQIDGSISNLAAHPELASKYDVLINFLLLKEADIQSNLAYLEMLLKICREREIQHLIHISSVSVYPGTERFINEDSTIEKDPTAKGAYGSLKVATDLYLLKHSPKDLRLSLVRPGFILGEGLADPIVGMAFRTPYNRLLVLGAKNNTVPVTTRDMVHQAIVSLAQSPASGNQTCDVSLLVSPNSPTRNAFLHTLCQQAGFGKGTIWLPTIFWKAGAYLGGLVESCCKLKLNVRKALLNSTRMQTFDSSQTSKTLGLDQTLNWQKVLVESLDSQEKNFAVPSISENSEVQLASVGFIGWGRIVKQKHLPAISKLGLKPKLLAYDLNASISPEGQEIRSIHSQDVENSDLYVVATPGPVHDQAIPLLEKTSSAIIVEKPLAYGLESLNRWMQFAERRSASIVVCHNYRFKKNVELMWECIRNYNPGPIRSVDIWFQSPPVANESAPWLKHERLARTLLFDYGIHFLDVACMLSTDKWTIDSVRYDLNRKGETSLIQGQISCPSYSVSLLLRQGAFPRRSQIRYVFQNYDITLDFFPETFSSSMSPRSPYLLRQNASRLRKEIFNKVLERFLKQDYDTSHAQVYRQALSNSDMKLIEIRQLENFYRMLYELGDRVYL
jgi:nucleoside-diphosphate-sugar epimerase